MGTVQRRREDSAAREPSRLPDLHPHYVEVLQGARYQVSHWPGCLQTIRGLVGAHGVRERRVQPPGSQLDEVKAASADLGR